MRPDPRTLAVYDSSAEEYSDLEESRRATARADAFIAAMPPGGQVLDLGCGPGKWAARMAAAGLSVDALDASTGMAEVARARFGIEVRIGSFAEVSGENVYDGIWAHFSLLHAPRAALPGILSALARALRPGGLFVIGMKLGTGEGRDGRDRLYTYYSEAELDALLTEAGFSIVERQTGEGIGFDGRPHPMTVISARLP